MDDGTRAEIERRIAAYEVARDAALAQANQHQGAVDALRALLVPPPPDPLPPPLEGP